MLLNKAHPRLFVASERPQKFAGVFFDWLLFGDDGFVHLLETVGATVVPCCIVSNKMHIPSRRIANFCNTANKDEKNCCQFQFDKKDGSINIISSSKIHSESEVLVKYGKEFSFDTRERELVLKELRNCSDKRKKLLMVFVDSFEWSGLFPQKEDVFQALRESLAVVETPAPTATPTPVPEVQKKHPMRW